MGRDGRRWTLPGAIVRPFSGEAWVDSGPKLQPGERVTVVPVGGSRFAPFSNSELCALWKGQTMDDGIQYRVEEDDPDYPLVRELYEEARRRKLCGSFWENVV